jgi:flavin-dependent dehydrogenase
MTFARDFDVLIFGTGPAGSAAALALQRIGITRIGLVGRPPRPGWRIGEAAPPELNRLVGELGLPEDLGALGHARCHGNVSAWGGSVQIHDFLRNGLGPGWHLNRQAFDAWLLDMAVQRGATLINSKRIDAPRRDGDLRWKVALSSGGRSLELSAAVLVIATGRAAASALRLQARIHRLDHLIAVAAVYRCDSSQFMPGYSLIEAAEFGWWYSAPLPGGDRITALMTDNDLIRKHSLLHAANFTALLSGTHMLCRFVPRPSDTIAIRTFPASAHYRDRAAGAGWFAVGDALMALDPLTSAGITGALRDAIDVAVPIMTIVRGAGGKEKRDLAQAHAYRANETWRRFLRERTMIYGQEKRWPHSAFWRRRLPAIPHVNDVESIGPPLPRDGLTAPLPD